MVLYEAAHERSLDVVVAFFHAVASTMLMDDELNIPSRREFVLHQFALDNYCIMSTSPSIYSHRMSVRQ